METNLFDYQGYPVAYIEEGTGRAIFTWDGYAVCYIVGEIVYGWNGKHIGWFVNGILYDTHGKRVGYTNGKCPSATKAIPAKSAKHAKHAKSAHVAHHARPSLSTSTMAVSLQDFLLQGAK